MKVDACEVKWNSSGKYGIVIASCDVDKSGASYYGQTLLYFISSRGESNQVKVTSNFFLVTNLHCQKNA